MDVLVVCRGGLKGLPEAVEATWPQAMAQTCVVHLIRAANRFVADHDRKAVCRSLRQVYGAAGEEQARKALDGFRQSELGRRYPSVAATWERAWDRFTPFLQFPPMLRRVACTTNSIESLNYQLRKVSRNRSQFPNDQAAVKLLWLDICDIEDNAPGNGRRRTRAGATKASAGSSRAGSPPTGNRPSPNSPPHTPNAWNHTSKKQKISPIHKQFDKLMSNRST